MSRSIVAVEMMTLNKNGIMEFKEVPTLPEVNIESGLVLTRRFGQFSLWIIVWKVIYCTILQFCHIIVYMCVKAHGSLFLKHELWKQAKSDKWQFQVFLRS